MWECVMWNMMFKISIVCGLSLAMVSCGGTQTDDTVFCGLENTFPTDSDVPEGEIAFQPDEDDRVREAGVLIIRDDGSRASELNFTGGTDGRIFLASLRTAVDNDGEHIEESVGELLSAGTFPICVNLKARSATDGDISVAPLVSTYTTSDTSTGTLAILGKEGDNYVGRFAFVAEQTSGETVNITRGAFRVPAQ